MTTSSDTLPRRDLHPAMSEKIESKLIARQVDHVFEPNLQITAIRSAEGHQVRFDEHRAPKQMVDRYAEQMRRGAVFPAIVVTDARELIDGNTRCAAALKNRFTTIPAYVCSGMTSLETRSLSIELNQTHGLRMTDQEIRAFVGGCVREGVVVDTNVYARMTGVKANSIARWIAVEQFHARAARLGLSSETESLSEAVVAALPGARLDAVFRAATELAVATGFSAADSKAIVVRANAAPSERDALALIARERSVRAAAVRPGLLSNRSPRSTRSSLHVGGLLRFDVEDLLDVAPDKQRETLTGLRMVRDLLNAALMAAEKTWEMHEVTTESPQSLVVA